MKWQKWNNKSSEKEWWQFQKNTCVVVWSSPSIPIENRNSVFYLMYWYKHSQFVSNVRGNDGLSACTVGWSRDLLRSGEKMAMIQGWEYPGKIFFVIYCRWRLSKLMLASLSYIQIHTTIPYSCFNRARWYVLYFMGFFLLSIIICVSSCFLHKEREKEKKWCKKPQKCASPNPKPCIICLMTFASSWKLRLADRPF